MDRCCFCFGMQPNKTEHKDEQERISKLEKEVTDIKATLTRLENTTTQKTKRDRDNQLTNFELAW